MMHTPSMDLRRLWLGDFADVTGQAPCMTPDGKRRTAPQILYDAIDFENAEGIVRFVAALRDQANFCEKIAGDRALPDAARSYAAERARMISASQALAQ